MSLTNLYTELHRTAQRSGEDRALTLKGGARLAVRVVGDVTTLTISRPTKRLSATEIAVFKRDCGIPATAVRFPMEGQNPREIDGVTRWYVAYRWREEVRA